MNQSILDQAEQWPALDPSQVLESATRLADQMADAWDQVAAMPAIQLPHRPDHIIIAAMGGSALGGDVIRTALRSELDLPITIINDYALPKWASSNTLVYLASYSGGTEETLAAAQEAEARGCLILGLTTGGKLKTWFEERSIPFYNLIPTHNPSNQPRMALGYAIVGTIALLAKAGVFNLDESRVNQAIAAVRKTIEDNHPNKPSSENAAKQLAFELTDRIPVLVGAEHLEGALHVVQNQLNENAKSYAEYRLVPELNHHLMEGLRHPNGLDAHTLFILWQSRLYHERTQKRMTITQGVIEQANLETRLLDLDATDRFVEAWEVIAFGALLNVYLAYLYGVNPAPIPTVDYFKEQLS